MKIKFLFIGCGLALACMLGGANEPAGGCSKVTVEPQSSADPFITQEDAQDLVIQQVIQPFKQTHTSPGDESRVIVAFSTTEALPIGTTVRPFLSRDPNETVTLTAPTYFFVVDLNFEAADFHRYKYVFINSLTGEMAVNDVLSHPAINDEVFLYKEYHLESPQRFFPETAAKLSYQPSSWLAKVWDYVIPSAHANECPEELLPGRKVAIVVSGEEHKSHSSWIRNSANEVGDILESVGFTVQRYHAPDDTFTETKNAIIATGTDLDQCDVFVLYIAAHGWNDGAWHSGNDWWNYSTTTANSLPQTLARVRAGSVNVVIDSCGSGGFYDHLTFTNNIQPYPGSHWNIFPSAQRDTTCHTTGGDPDEDMLHYASLFIEYMDDLDLDSNVDLCEIEDYFMQVHEEVRDDSEIAVQNIPEVRTYRELVISISDDVTIQEGDVGETIVSIEVSLSNIDERAVGTFNFTTNDGSAVAGQDYEAQSGQFAFSSGVTSHTIDIPVFGDRDGEGHEDFTVTISPATGSTNAQLPRTSVRVLLINDDVNLSINDASIPEGNNPGSLMLFDVTLSGPSTEQITVEYYSQQSQIITAINAIENDDYLAATGLLIFQPGETSKQIQLATYGDPTPERNETFNMWVKPVYESLLAVDNTSDVALGTILNDDFILTIDDPSRQEGDQGTHELDFTVTLLGEASGPVTVDYTTVEGTASPGSDFISSNGTLTFTPPTLLAPAQVTRFIPVSIVGDTDEEADETVFVQLSNASVAITKNQGTGTILNDEATLSISDAAPVLETGLGAEGPNHASLTITLSGPVAETVRVFYITSSLPPATAISGPDYPFTSGEVIFNPGDPLTQVITIPIVDDIFPEEEEIFFVTLNLPINAGILDGRGEVRIQDDDS